ncbi:Terpenoid synthase [Mycena venus]|uniref:(2E,6E)-farnesyl diphosphate synthase n=1 Tax=Mycena venus TaxID=2733690 RepID=A0A8H6WU33_9AGAR|nr:Terpenoid synthase [Mycena venus]
MALTDVLSSALTRSSFQDAGILDPFAYTASRPGKGVRARLFSAFNVWMNVPQAEIEIIEKVVCMLHDASLMLDDIEDNSQLRRGRPAAHTVYGIPRTINAATYVHTMVYQELLHMKSSHSEYSDLVMILTAELDCLHHGQGLDIIWRDSFHCPTEAEYMHMVKNKTGGLLRMGGTPYDGVLNHKQRHVSRDYVTLVDLIGAHYQIRDDYMNLLSPDYSANKGFAEDIEEGKFSFPIIHGVHTNTSNQLILDVLKSRPATLTLKTQIIGYLQHETKSFNYTVAVLDALEVEINNTIRNLGGNAELSEIVKGLHVDGTTFN